MNTKRYGWNAIDWRNVNVQVFKLQKRIYRASSCGKTETVHRLQKLLLKSRSAVLLAVRRVTQENKGKHTAGIDGLSSLNVKERLKLVEKILQNPYETRVKALRRAWVPKPGKDEKRPLGIPVIEDRARQALVKLALEPEWEAKFEPNSYGFRPARSCQDAIEAIYRQIRLVPKWVLDADIAGCFDNINHEALLGKLGTFPKLRRIIKAWLKSGVLDEGTLFPTEEGTPQGGVISPLLANIALHGLEETVKDAFPENRFFKEQNLNVRWKPQIVRYADDFVILHRDRKVIGKAQEIAAKWLKQMGLEMKPSKTRIVHTLEKHDGQVGFDFLGFNIRQYPRSKSSCIRMPKTGNPTGFTPSIRPSKESQKRLLRKVKQILKSNRSVSQVRLINLLNPVIRGWGNYYSKVVSKDVFRRLHSLIYEQLRSWTNYRHSNKGHKWIVRKYWSFSDKWEFGVRDRIKLVSLPEIPVRRHVCLRVNKSPFDGDWIYWSRRLGQYPDMPKSKAIRLRLQDGICSSCGLHFCPDDEMVILHLDGNNKNFRRDNMTLVHRRCVTALRSVHIDAAFN